MTNVNKINIFKKHHNTYPYIPYLFLDTTAGAGRFLLDGLDVALRDAVMRCAPFFIGQKW